MKQKQRVEEAIMQILNSNLQLDMPHPLKAKRTVVNEIVALFDGQYDSQFRETPSDEIRQKLIAYDKFMSSHDFNGRLLSPEQAVDEFLKQK